jgi:hypothetical protein
MNFMSMFYSNFLFVSYVIILFQTAACTQLIDIIGGSLRIVSLPQYMYIKKKEAVSDETQSNLCRLLV